MAPYMTCSVTPCPYLASNSLRGVGLRMKWLLVALAMMVAMMTPSGVQAVSCAPMEPGLPRFEVVVRGAISAIPKGGVMHLRISRYYKGTGPWLLVAEVEGIGQGHRMDLLKEPRVGDEVVIALRREGARLVNTLCNPLTFVKAGEESPKWVIDQFGHGLPPEGEEPPQKRLPF
jgi:hypothetical protein